MNRTYGSFFCYLIRNMMLTASVAAAIRSDSFSKSVTHTTPTKGVNRHSPVAGFIIARIFFIGKHKREQIFVCSLFVSSFCLRHLHVYFIIERKAIREHIGERLVMPKIKG